jgi:hypothetical protein
MAVKSILLNQKNKQPLKIVMTAIASSQIYSNQLYPDNETTIYGSTKRKLSLLQKSIYGFGTLV